ncbi:YchJ family protein [Almyronema epifaneia]|uniref:YchJ family protein n=1 Tax=Almyronema epifaneia S1 TaxID=2991925 RepID=A0ABW6IFG4_9CYAN
MPVIFEVTSGLPCACSSGKAYAVCCEPYLLRQAEPPTAEALMRSRYTAYCRGKIDYLVATRHPRQRRFDDRLTLSQSIKNTTWLGLTILETCQGQPAADLDYVEFVAIYKGDEVGQLHEKSKFVKHQGRWFYWAGKLLPPLAPKRNEPCWCGSGKKFKQCHGKG